MISLPDDADANPFRSSLEARELNAAAGPGMAARPASILWAHPVNERPLLMRGDDHRRNVDSTTPENLEAPSPESSTL